MTEIPDHDAQQENTIMAAARRFREAAGYSFDQLALTSGLTVAELTALESGEDDDQGKLEWLAAALGLPREAACWSSMS